MQHASGDGKDRNTEHSLPTLGAATWPQVDLSSRRLLLLPLGSTEQHGPHLPLSTDTVIASRLAQEVHRTYPQVGLAPAMPYGASGEHAEFAGTLSIGTEALTTVLIEFTRHAATMWRHILVVNGHGGNCDALHAASSLLREEGRSLTVYHAASSGPQADPHAGFRETSLMLHLDPDSVTEPLIAPGNVSDLSPLLPRIRANGVRSVSENGVLGNPQGANARAGKEIFSTMRDRLLGVTTQLLSS